MSAASKGCSTFLGIIHRNVEHPLPPRTPSFVACRSGAQSSAAAHAGRRTRPQRQLQLEPGVGILERIAEPLAQLAEPVADRLGVDVEPRRDRYRVAALLEPRRKRLLQPVARAGRQLL